MMRTLGYSIATLLLLTTATAAAQTAAPAREKADRAATEAHRRADIARHRQMARAHEEAARCLEAGEKEAVCHERLREACKGIAVGRYCGMRHEH